VRRLIDQLGWIDAIEVDFVGSVISRASHLIGDYQLSHNRTE